RSADERYADAYPGEPSPVRGRSRPPHRFEDEPPPGPPLSGKALAAMIVGLSALMVVGLLAIPDIALALRVFTFILPSLSPVPPLLFAFLGLPDLNKTPPPPP